ncbi:MG2 domain-containing protein [Polyangium sp. y55x31]|uniref:alpha-2-macroglobulin family protein n=1 Tax=Polyangium sp. y55x31 TaxID=3042688 RepID=UPI0024824AD8|nr:MG2 domain-containing protein [Polyangium sp. y55x31]MDI1479759.1 MG2 domain-containing protein [Polyangium sp. y55x31]
MSSARTRPVWLVPAVLLASSFGLVCSSTPSVPTTLPGQPPPPVVIERAVHKGDEPLVFPPAVSRNARLPVYGDEVDRTSTDLDVQSPSLDSDGKFSFHGTSFRISFNQRIARPAPDPKAKGPQKAAEGTIRLTPSVEGEAYWLNDTTLEFVAKRPFDTETTYAVELGELKTPAGAGLKQAWKAQFKATPGVTIAGKDLGYIPVPGRHRVIAMHPNDGLDVGARETFAVLYDQPIDLGLARTLITLTEAASERPISVVFDHPKTPTFQGIKVDPKLVVLVRPVSPVAPGTKLVLQAKPRFVEKLHQAREVEVTVAEPLAFKDVTCEWYWDDDGRQRSCTFQDGKLYTAGREVRVAFNQAVATPDDKLAARVRVSPAVRNMTVRNERWDNEIAIRGELEPSKSYEVSIEGLTDDHGNRLVKPVSFRVEMAPMPASVTMADGMLWLDPETTRHFAVTSRNVSKASLLAWPVASTDRAAQEAALRRVRTRDLPPEAAPVRIPIAIKAERNKLVTTQIDLSKHLSTGQNYITTIAADEIAFSAKLAKFPRGSEAAKPLVALIRPGDERSLAVHTRATPNATIVQVSRLAGGAPVQGALVRLSGDENSAGVTTDASGVALLPFDLRATARPFLDVRAQDADFILPLDGDGITESQIFPDLASGEGAPSSFGRAFVLTDRGIYRPGSSVFVKATVRKPDGAMLSPVAGASLRLRVVGPTGDDVFQQTLTTNDMGSLSTTITIPADAKIGRHLIHLEQPEQGEDAEPLARTIVQVAEFEPPRFVVDVDASADAKNALRAEVRARYLFGAPMDGASASWTVRREGAPFPEGPLTSAGLSFRRASRWYDDEEEPWSRAGEGSLSADGKLAVVQALEIAPALGPQKFVIEADVTDASHRHVAGRGSVVVHPAKRYAGMKLPSTWYGVGDDVPVELGVIDPEGRPIEGATVTAKLERIEWQYAKRRGAGGSLEWDWTSKRIEAGRCTATSAKQPVTCKVNIGRSGSYEITAEVDGRPGGAMGLWAYGSEGEALPAAPERPHALDLSADKSKYAPGETAKILVRNPFPEATLVTTIEQGHLLEKRAMRVKAGATVIDVPLRPEHAPFVHATATLLPIGAKGRAATDYKIGAVRLPVSMAGARLEVTARSDKPFYRPGDEAEIDIEVMDGGKPEGDAEVALAVVDEGVLRLTDFHPIDPAVALRPGRGLSFRVRDSRSDLGELFERSHVPGDGGGAALSTITEARKKFVETALFKPDVRPDAQGKAKVRFKLPDNLTEFRIMAVALDREGKGAKSESSFLVKKPVMLVPVVPRFARVGDRFEAAAMLHNETAAALGATVRLGARSQTVNVPAGGKARVGFSLEPAAAGALPLVFSAEDEAGKRLDEVEAKLSVDEPGIDERPRLGGAFVRNEEVLLDVPAGVIERGGFLTVKVGEHLWPELGARLEWLLGYPHGCVEQTTSSTLPLIAARTILPRIGVTRLSEGELQKRIAAGIQRLATMRTDSGGLAYWPGGDEPNVYGTAYAIRAVILAKKAGVNPPAGLLEGMQRFLADRMLDEDTAPEVSAAIAESLADAGALDRSAADALFDRKDNQSVFGLGSLALALASLPDQEDRVKTLLDMIEGSFDERGVLSNTKRMNDFYYYGSPSRSRAQAAIALARLRRSSLILPLLLREIAADMDDYTTQATAYSLLALSQHLEASTDDGVAVRIQLDGESLAPTADLGFGSKEFAIPLSRVRGKKMKLMLTAEGDRSVGYAISSAWQRAIAASDSPAATRGENGPSVYRVISDPRGGAVELSKVRAGDLLRVALYARLPEVGDERRGYVALTDRLPAGFEPVQPDLATVASAPGIDSHHPFYSALRWSSSEASHIEMRDDRVNVYFDKVWGDSVAATYLVRATTPGVFALPAAAGELMYEPDSVGYSDAGQVTIQ